MTDVRPFVHEELHLRCDCGVEHLDVDLWFTCDFADGRVKDIEAWEAEGSPVRPDDGYLTVTQAHGIYQRWWGVTGRLRAAWTILRGREHILTSVILKPEDQGRLREFFAGLSAPGGDGAYVVRDDKIYPATYFRGVGEAPPPECSHVDFLGVGVPGVYTGARHRCSGCGTAVYWNGSRWVEDPRTDFGP